MALSKNVVEAYVRCQHCKLEYHVTFGTGLIWAKVPCPNCQVELEFFLREWIDALKKRGIFSRDDRLRHGYESNPSLRNVVKWKDVKMNMVE